VKAIFVGAFGLLIRRLNMLNVDQVTTPSPSIPLPRGEREVEPLSLDGGVALGQRGWREDVNQPSTIINCMINNDY
jgi:hypothetical protein